MKSPELESDSLPFANSKWFAFAATVLLLIGVVFAFGRAYSNYSVPKAEFDWSATGLSDFHSMYTYTKAFRRGLSPYESHESEDLVMSRPSAPFSPLVFFILWPLSMLPMGVADVFLCLANLAMIGWIARQVFTYGGVKFHRGWWLAVFGFLVLSRAGHITLYTGYITPLLVIGTLMAFQYGKRTPWLSGVGIMLTSIKPTYILPLLIILAFRRNYKAAAFGVVFSGLVAFAGITWLAADSSYSAVLDTIRHGQDAFREDASEFPINTWTRIDLVGMFAKVIDWNPDKNIYLAAMLVLLIPPGLVIRKIALTEHNSSATGLSAFIGMLALLVGIYHHSYDCLLLAVPWLAMLLFGRQTLANVPRWHQLTIGLLLFIPAINYVSTLAGRNLLKLEQLSLAWQSITLINGVCLALSLLILINSALRSAPSPEKA
jgi:hypothetical protein